MVRTEYLDAVEEAIAARMRYSTAWLRYKAAKKDVTDRQAEHQAYVECGAERDRAEAQLEVARSKLNVS